MSAENPPENSPGPHSSEELISRQVAEASAALASCRHLGCRWWQFLASQRTLKLVIGDSMARGGNMVLALFDCDFVAGPVRWEKQNLELLYAPDPTRTDGWLITLKDDRVQFRATAWSFDLQRDINLVKGYTAWIPREDSPGSDAAPSI